MTGVFLVIFAIGEEWWVRVELEKIFFGNRKVDIYDKQLTLTVRELIAWMLIKDVVLAVQYLVYLVSQVISLVDKIHYG